MSIQTAAQSSAPGERVELFRLDASSIGGNIESFCQGSSEAGGVTFQGVYYTPVDCDFDGFETNSSGALPTPKLKVKNAGGIFQALVNTYGDMVGSTIMRMRTFRRFLDGEPEADPTAFFGPDIFRIDRKSSENKQFIEWELSAAIDQEGKMLPGRVVVRDTCLWRYRRWKPDTLSFDYSKAQCPYTGANGSFNELDLPVADAFDKPSRRLSCCKKRFGEAGPFPFGGFPGSGRVNS